VSVHRSEPDDVELAVAAALAGAHEVRSRYGTPVAHHAKSPTDFATEADLEAERAIRALLMTHRPDDAVLGEEGGLEGDPTTTRRWYVDPLCGTLNFAAQTPLVGVNVALRVDTTTTAAAVADPFSGEVFLSGTTRAVVRHEGVDRALAPSPATRLVDVHVDGDPVWSARLIGHPAFTPRFGFRDVSTSLAAVWVSAGRRAGYVQRGPITDSVHFEAPLAICRAAGCVVSDLAGGPPDDGLVVAADAATHAALVEAIRLSSQ